MEEKEVVVNYTEILQEMYGEMQVQTEELVAMREEFQGVKENVWDINATTGLLFLVAVFSFCWSCVRQWRKNVLKMG